MSEKRPRFRGRFLDTKLGDRNSKRNRSFRIAVPHFGVQKAASVFGPRFTHICRPNWRRTAAPRSLCPYAGSHGFLSCLVRPSVFLGRTQLAACPFACLLPLVGSAALCFLFPVLALALALLVVVGFEFFRPLYHPLDALVRFNPSPYPNAARMGVGAARCSCKLVTNCSCQRMLSTCNRGIRTRGDDGRRGLRV